MSIKNILLEKNQQQAVSATKDSTTHKGRRNTSRFFMTGSREYFKGKHMGLLKRNITTTKRLWNIMLTLINIEKKDGLIVADYYYDDESDVGHIEYDILKDKIIKKRYNALDKNSLIKYGFSKISKACRLMIENNKYPDAYHYIWY